MVTAVVGLQLGDEGKGKKVDALAESAAYVVRYNGGANAGHTVVTGQGKFVLHQVPCGVLHAGCRCLLGTGMVVDPAGLLAELAGLEARGVDTSGVLLSDRAHLVLPWHKEQDAALEAARGAEKLDTTLRGIGPAYADKAARVGVRAGDLLDTAGLPAKLAAAAGLRGGLAGAGRAPAAGQVEAVLAAAAAWAAALAPRLVDAVPLLGSAWRSGQEIMLEGQLGLMRDLDWGYYPYVTSSNASAAYAACGAGLPATAVRRVIGVTKAYNTAVGAGPFPSQAEPEIAGWLRERGEEYGATTGRARVGGWFDAVAARYAAYLTGATELAVTKIDVLSGMPEIRICVAYDMPEGRTTDNPPALHQLAKAQPVYETWPGWDADLSQIRTRNKLPANAVRLVERIAELTEVPVRLVSIGPHRAALLEW